MKMTNNEIEQKTIMYLEKLRDDLCDGICGAKESQMLSELTKLIIALDEKSIEGICKRLKPGTRISVEYNPDGKANSMSGAVNFNVKSNNKERKSFVIDDDFSSLIFYSRIKSITIHS